MTATYRSIYRRAISAVVLPAVLLLALQTIYFDALFDAMCEIALRHAGAKWLLFAVLAGLTLLEWQYLVTFGRLLRAKGRVEGFLALESDPIEIVRRRRVRFRLSTVGLSTLFAFTVAEAVFRVAGIQPPPAASTPFAESEKVDNSLNALGIREEWDSLPDDDPRLRIAFLGDSMAYGHSVQPYEAFCHLVESALTGRGTPVGGGAQTPVANHNRTAGADGMSHPNPGSVAHGLPHGVVTINLGYPGTSPGWQLQRYLPIRDQLRPDVVVHVVYPNDLGIEPDHRLRAIYRLRDDALWIGPRLSKSYVLRYAERQIRYWLAWNETIDYFRGGRNPKERAEAWTQFKAEVRACKTAIEEGGGLYVMVLFPVLVRLDDYALTDVHVDIRRFASELTVPYLDLLDTFAGRDAESLRVSLGNEHPNAFAHRLAAERIVRFLLEEVLPALPSKRPDA